MTTWAGLQPILRAPVMALAYSVVFDGEEYDPERFKTGDPDDPGTWVLWQTSVNASDYGTFSGDDERRVQGDVLCKIFVEPGGSGDGVLFDVMDALETAYTGQDTTQIIFHHHRAWPTEISVMDGEWLRRDWRIPFEWMKEAS